jgi:ABC transporter with metal-binding/Fe-S-binding domain ATP-binding protein
VSSVRRLAALFSGGKDSTHALHLAAQAGFEVAQLVTARPARDDSFMFHTPNLDMTRLAAQAMGLPLLEVPVSGEPEREVKELAAALRPLAEAGQVDGLLAGAIASDYQWARLNAVGHALSLACHTPMWRVRAQDVLRDEVASGLKFMIVAAQSEGLTPEWLGHTFDEPLLEQLLATAKVHRFNPAGEGGEYETLVTDGPLFSKRIRIEAYHVDISQSSSRMVVDEAELVEHRGPV